MALEKFAFTIGNFTRGSLACYGILNVRPITSSNIIQLRIRDQLSLLPSHNILLIAMLDIVQIDFQ